MKSRLVIALIVTLASASAAIGANQMFARAIAPDGDIPIFAVQAPEEVVPEVRSGADYLAGILGRNLFDAAYIDALGDGPTPMAPRHSVSLLLKGTVVAEPVSFSSALIATEDERPLGYGLYDRVADLKIVGIGKKQVTLQHPDGELEVLRMNVPSAEPMRPSAPASSGAPNDITKLADNRYSVPRSTLDSLLANPAAIAQLGKGALHTDADGQIDGFRLTSIRRDSLATKLGIRNGDVVHGVNGQPLNSIQAAMGALQGLSSDSDFAFEITRRGQRMTMDYEVR